jgi:hypothetical protein
MTLRDDAIERDREERLAAAQARLVTEQRQHASTRRELARVQERVEELAALLDRYTAVHPGDLKVPKWITKRSRKGAHHATALLMLSDLHLDEVVDLAAMSGLNEYNREIAERRLERVIDGTVRLATEYVSGVTWDGIVVALNGDLLSGDIHEELARTNVAPTTASVTYWVPRLAAALTHLADTFGAVFVPCTDGNHDRNYRKTPSKQRAESSFAWVIYNWLADMLRDDERITFAITTAPGQCYPIYDTVFHQSHGDAFRSAGGVGGLYPSMLKHIHRLDAMWAAQGVAVDVHLFGHWHQYLTGPNFIVNGSLKGYDEYARANAFRPEPARQALAVVTPERGIVQQMPVYAD